MGMMSEVLDIVVVTGALLGAAVYLFRRFRSKGAPCNTGCGKCGDAAAQKEEPLVQLRRR